MAFDGGDAAFVADERRHVRRLAAGSGAQVEDALAGLRVEGSGHRHRGARLRHEQALLPLRRGERVERGVDDEALGQVVCRPGGDREVEVVGLSVLIRTAASAGSLPAAIRARASSGAEGVEPELGDPERVRVLEGCFAGVPSGSEATIAGASRAARRRTALTRPAPPREVCLASSTDSRTAAWAGTRSRNASWSTPSLSGADRRLEALDRPAGELRDHVVECGAALDHAVRKPRCKGAISRVEPVAPRLAVERPVGVGAVLEYAADDRGARARGARCARSFAALCAPWFVARPRRAPC